MNKQILVLCGKESIYIKRMYEYILSNYGEDFEVILFTKESLFKDFIIDNPVEIIIAEEDFGIPKECNATVTALLGENPGEKGKVYKYLPCDLIIQDLMTMCASSKLARVSDGPGSTKLIGVYSPISRCSQTTFAIALGQILAKSHKVLYLNFECYSGFELLTRPIGNKDLMDLVYFSEIDEDNIRYRLDSIKERIGNLDYISPIKAYVRYADISKKQWEKLFNNLKEKTDYEYIIMDFSEHVNGLFSLLRSCSHIFTINDTERMASAKMTQYEELLKMGAYEDVIRKTEKVIIPKFKDIPSDFTMLPYSDLAKYIKKKIIDEMDL